ncbi:hypothetical protein GCM10009530_27000 [Microbispora corallina]|uniref:Uncharacterized protein n=1 Tax=Microbispora corallina TaxID=83302 RepID=A0ABQ4G531_9ACTN|nr:hypothetical protein Mco01_51810 [Microbispora corallina]
MGPDACAPPNSAGMGTDAWNPGVRRSAGITGMEPDAWTSGAAVADGAESGTADGEGTDTIEFWDHWEGPPTTANGNSSTFPHKLWGFRNFCLIPRASECPPDGSGPPARAGAARTASLDGSPTGDDGEGRGGAGRTAP